MKHIANHVIHLSQNEDGTYLVASADSPRFCFLAPTREEARDKAQRALEYFASVGEKSPSAPKEARVISPLFHAEELCA